MYNTTGLINSIKRNTMYPSSANKYSDSDFIAVINEQLQTLVATEFLTMDQDYFIDSEDVTLVADQDYYNINKKASGWIIQEIYYQDSSGNLTKLPRRTRKLEGDSTSVSNEPTMIILEDGRIRVYPDMGTAPTGTLKVYFQRVQNLLRPVSECGKITNVASVGTDYELTVASTPIGYSNNVDVISKDNPYSIIATNKTASLAGLVITVSQADFDQTPVNGDYVCETGYTLYPHIPSEWHPLLAISAACQFITASGDQNNLATLTKLRDEMFGQMRKVIKNRVKSSPKKLVSRNYVLNMQRFARRTRG